ncbi:MAG: hypothetical protein R2839_12530 [Thermomicrobiales bacterium]
MAAGLHTLTQIQAPEGFENVGTLDVNVDQDANFAVRHTVASEPEPTPTEEIAAPPGLTVGFVSVDQMTTVCRERVSRSTTARRFAMTTATVKLHLPACSPVSTR